MTVTGFYGKTKDGACAGIICDVAGSTFEGDRRLGRAICVAADREAGLSRRLATNSTFSYGLIAFYMGLLARL